MSSSHEWKVVWERRLKAENDSVRVGKRLAKRKGQNAVQEGLRFLQGLDGFPPLSPSQSHSFPCVSPGPNAACMVSFKVKFNIKVKLDIIYKSVQERSSRKGNCLLSSHSIPK